MFVKDYFICNTWCKLKIYLFSMTLLLLLLAITIDDNVEDDEAGRLLADVLLIVLGEQPIFKQSNSQNIISMSHILT